MSESNPEWINQLPDELRSHPAIKNTPDVATLAKRLVDLDSYKGRSIALPKDGDEDSARSFSEAVKKRGFVPGVVPDSPDQYEFGEVSAPSDQWLADKRQSYHRLGLTTEQAKAAVQQEIKILQESQAKLTQTFSEGDMEAARKAAAAYGVDPADPVSVIKLLKEVGSNMTTGEDGARVGALGGVPTETPEAIGLKIHEINLKMGEIPTYDPRYRSLLEAKSRLIQQRVALESGEQIKIKSLDELAIGGRPRGY